MPHFLRGTATSWRLDHGLIAAGLALCVAIASVTGWLALMQKHRGIDGEAQNLERLSLVVADHVDRSFRSIDALHGSIVQSLPADAVQSPAAFAAFAARPDTAALLDQRRQGLGFLDDLVLLDAGGRVLASAQAGSGKPAAGAAPFATLLQTPTRGAATSGPVRDAALGTRGHGRATGWKRSATRKVCSSAPSRAAFGSATSKRCSMPSAATAATRSASIARTAN